LNPSGGHGAVTALHDAIALANLLYAMPTSTSADITNIFQEYQKERYPAVMESYNNSRFVAKVSDRGIIGRIILYLITHMPMWLWRLAVSSLVLILQEQIMHWQKEFLIYEENFF
jgi:2-polyprenyl-6-methoxyphenol hydroxylase-like FAD-dependent oxidoreductase